MGSPSLTFGGALEGHGAGELQGGFSGHALDGVKRLFADVVSLEEDLGFPGPVAQVDEADGALASVGFHESNDGDVLVNEVSTVGLEFAEGVGSICGGDPSGHARRGRGEEHEAFASTSSKKCLRNDGCSKRTGVSATMRWVSNTGNWEVDGSRSLLNSVALVQPCPPTLAVPCVVSSSSWP